MKHPSEKQKNADRVAQDVRAESVCPVCGAELLHEKCKVVCRSEICVYRIIYNCAEF